MSWRYDERLIRLSLDEMMNLKWWEVADVDLDLSRDIQRCAAEGSELARLAISRIQGSLDPILELVFRVKLQEHVVAQSVSRVPVARIGPAAFIPSNVMRFNVDHGKHVRLLLCHFGFLSLR